jgi:hypothetical protein
MLISAEMTNHQHFSVSQPRVRPNGSGSVRSPYICTQFSSPSNDTPPIRPKALGIRHKARALSRLSSLICGGDDLQVNTVRLTRVLR